jgi:hypothetical protein
MIREDASLIDIMRVGRMENLRSDVSKSIYAISNIKA